MSTGTLLKSHRGNARQSRISFNTYFAISVALILLMVFGKEMGSVNNVFLISDKNVSSQRTSITSNEKLNLMTIPAAGNKDLTSTTSQARHDHIAVCFFGLVKNFSEVSHSVQNHIFNVLKSQNITYDIFAHTFNLTIYSNSHNKENTSKIVPHSLQHILSIGDNAILYEDVEAADRMFDLRELLKNGDPWGNKGLSLRMLVRQFYSLRRVTDLWQQSGRAYDFCLYLRPDLFFISDLDLPQMRPRLNESTIATPGWAKWRGLNDRLAFGVPSVMAAYGRRADALRDYVASGRRPHAEEFLGWYAASRGVANVDSAVRFYRWRVDGRPDEQDSLYFLMVERADKRKQEAARRK